MLEKLRSIIQEVNEAKDLNASLEIIVRRVQKAMETRVCSVYLLDTNLERYVLMATKGPFGSHQDITFEISIKQVN